MQKKYVQKKYVQKKHVQRKNNIIPALRGFLIRNYQSDFMHSLTDIFLLSDNPNISEPKFILFLWRIFMHNQNTKSEPMAQNKIASLFKLF